MILAELKNKVTKKLEKLDLEKIKNETAKQSLKAATTALDFGTKVVEKVGGKFQKKETEKVSKDKKPRKKINRIRKF
jgi:hypothetical protein